MKGNAGSVWILHRPVVFIDAGERKERRRGRHADTTLPRCLRQHPGRGREEKRGWRVDIMLPCCLWGGMKENVGSVWVAHCPIAVVDATGSPYPTISWERNEHKRDDMWVTRHLIWFCHHRRDPLPGEMRKRDGMWISCHLIQFHRPGRDPPPPSLLFAHLTPMFLWTPFSFPTPR